MILVMERIFQLVKLNGRDKGVEIMCFHNKWPYAEVTVGEDEEKGIYLSVSYKDKNYYIYLNKLIEAGLAE